MTNHNNVVWCTGVVAVVGHKMPVPVTSLTFGLVAVIMAVAVSMIYVGKRCVPCLFCFRQHSRIVRDHVQ